MSLWGCSRSSGGTYSRSSAQHHRSTNHRSWQPIFTHTWQPSLRTPGPYHQSHLDFITSFIAYHLSSSLFCQSSGSIVCVSMSDAFLVLFVFIQLQVEEETFQTKYRINHWMFLTYSFNKVPTGVFLLVFMSNGTQVNTMRNASDQKMADCQTSDRFCYHSLPQHHRTLIKMSIDG